MVTAGKIVETEVSKKQYLIILNKIPNEITGEENLAYASDIDTMDFDILEARKKDKVSLQVRVYDGEDKPILLENYRGAAVKALENLMNTN